MKLFHESGRLRTRLGRTVALLLDTRGPAIRTGDLKTDLHLKPGGAVAHRAVAL